MPALSLLTNRPVWARRPLTGRSTLACLIFAAVVSGCAGTPDCAGEADDPIDEALAPLDNAVGEVNQRINDEGPDGDCRLRTSSEIEKG